MAIGLRSWLRPDDTAAAQRLASRLWPRGPHPGGLGWEAAIEELPPLTMVAEEEGRLVGWAGVSSRQLLVQADPAWPEAARALLAWAREAADGGDVVIPVFEGDVMLESLLAAEGFVMVTPQEPLVGMWREATPEGPRLPAGYRIRGTRDDETEARVGVHRAAWRPATLPWPPEVMGTVSLEATSKFTSTAFERVRQTWLYDQDLDLVVEGPDGALVACCTIWWDPAIGCGEIEPLGVVPDHRRQGLASALCMEACARIEARGGTLVFINTGPRPDYPAPAATYATVGFVATPRAHIYGRPDEDRATPHLGSTAEEKR